MTFCTSLAQWSFKHQLNSSNSYDGSHAGHASFARLVAETQWFHHWTELCYSYMSSRYQESPLEIGWFLWDYRFSFGGDDNENSWNMLKQVAQQQQPLLEVQKSKMLLRPFDLAGARNSPAPSAGARPMRQHHSGQGGHRFLRPSALKQLGILLYFAQVQSTWESGQNHFFEEISALQQSGTLHSFGSQGVGETLFILNRTGHFLGELFNEWPLSDPRHFK